MLDLLFDASFMASVPRFVTPILLAALGGALCERAGVFNIALEGFILTGAFAAVLGSYFSGSPWLGAIAAMAAGIAIGLVFAEFHLRRGGDAIVVSIAINILAAGLTTYLLRAIFDVMGAFSDPAIVGFQPVRIPLIADIPVLGRVLSGQSPLVYVALLAVPAVHIFLARHRLGLRMRAAGENAAALEAGGVSPRRVRLWALVGCGTFCGLAGAQLSIANVNLFVENMSAGRGWIAIVAVLLTRGRPLPLFLIAAIFGTVDSFSFRVQGLGLAQQFTDMMPYLATLMVLVALSWWRKRQTA
ncbi:ABC transporter permease [Chelativorans sp. SCAU2101]|uniref:ABC transporter permease n=1 Tax=Chelativorans petroleitrophicus TaxID=2975484 RepID=A0A9X3B980_9HYPH|nr:ABC transporter permease [Chelativorans petroleitrophicus]MCT8989946.1 ABC transporter permease [Chelativorans petroleitrophicus]